MPDLSCLSLAERVQLGLRAAAAKALEVARQTKTPLIVWRDGKVVEISPDKIQPTKEND